ncbi:dual oxidase maturation factor 1-like isoform X2 [Haliotis rufescens]|uniref:dual oxidase maturation factor 1-like isoform X2 n=1 Tax=Haliotis rufescens TaxID=6454 RepID=UPI00201ED546|nr:dual oxidase maturation factor 1-like isoform X2 [Haliotis rufescens]
MGLYTAFRKNGAPTFYEANKTPFEADLLESGLIFCIVILAFSFYVVLPGIRGKEKLFTFTRITVSLFIGASILLSNFAMSWEESVISDTETKYKAGSGKDIVAEIGLHIGLRGVNITLKGEPEMQLNETINYNEHFSWEWRQGRLGFGPFAGRFAREYRAAQFRGLPLPILWIAEYFTFDGEGVRWGRFYRQAGWYTHILLWTAFPLWVLANILFFVLLRYGAYMLILTGICMVSGNIIWATVRNFNPLVIPFSAEHIMRFSFSSAFWLCLITGILCLVLGAVIFVLDLRYPRHIATFFNVDVLQDSEEIQVEEVNAAAAEVKDENVEDEDEDEDVEKRNNGASNAPRPETSNEDDIYEVRFDIPAPKMRSERTFTQRFQKNRRKTKRPPPPPPQHENSSEEEAYENAEAVRFYAQGKKASPKQVQLEMGAS